MIILRKAQTKKMPSITRISPRPRLVAASSTGKVATQPKSISRAFSKKQRRAHRKPGRPRDRAIAISLRELRSDSGEYRRQFQAFASKYALDG